MSTLPIRELLTSTILGITSISNLFLNPSKDNLMSVSFPFLPINLEEMMFGCWSDRDNSCPELAGQITACFSTNSENFCMYSTLFPVSRNIHFGLVFMCGIMLAAGTLYVYKY